MTQESDYDVVRLQARMSQLQGIIDSHVENLANLERTSSELRANLEALDREESGFRTQQKPSRSSLPIKEQLLRDSKSAFQQHPTSALLVLDLDNFKAVNDTKGHQEGDSCLDRVVSMIVEVIGRRGRIYRWGSGDEFAVLLPDFSTDEAKVTAERVRNAVENGKPAGDTVVTTSIGVCGTDRAGSKSAEEILDFADKAMYVSKKSGKNRVTAWSLAMGELGDGRDVF